MNEIVLQSFHEELEKIAGFSEMLGRAARKATKAVAGAGKRVKSAPSRFMKAYKGAGPVGKRFPPGTQTNPFQSMPKSMDERSGVVLPKTRKQRYVGRVGTPQVAGTKFSKHSLKRMKAMRAEAQPARFGTGKRLTPLQRASFQHRTKRLVNPQTRGAAAARAWDRARAGRRGNLASQMLEAKMKARVASHKVKPPPGLRRIHDKLDTWLASRKR